MCWIFASAVGLCGWVQCSEWLCGCRCRLSMLHQALQEANFEILDLELHRDQMTESKGRLRRTMSMEGYKAAGLSKLYMSFHPDSTDPSEGLVTWYSADSESQTRRLSLHGHLDTKIGELELHHRCVWPTASGELDGGCVRGTVFGVLISECVEALEQVNFTISEVQGSMTKEALEGAQCCLLQVVHSVGAAYTQGVEVDAAEGEEPVELHKTVAAALLHPVQPGTIDGGWIHKQRTLAEMPNEMTRSTMGHGSNYTEDPADTSIQFTAMVKVTN